MIIIKSSKTSQKIINPDGNYYIKIENNFSMNIKLSKNVICNGK